MRALFELILTLLLPLMRGRGLRRQVIITGTALGLTLVAVALMAFGLVMLGLALFFSLAPLYGNAIAFSVVGALFLLLSLLLIWQVWRSWKK